MDNKDTTGVDSKVPNSETVYWEDFFCVDKEKHTLSLNISRYRKNGTFNDLIISDNLEFIHLNGTFARFHCELYTSRSLSNYSFHIEGVTKTIFIRNSPPTEEELFEYFEKAPESLKLFFPSRK